MFCAPEPVLVEVHVSLQGSVGALSGGVLLDLFVGSFLKAISCEDTFVKSVYKEIPF